MNFINIATLTRHKFSCLLHIYGNDMKWYSNGYLQITKYIYKHTYKKKIHTVKYKQENKYTKNRRAINRLVGRQKEKPKKLYEKKMNIWEFCDKCVTNLRPKDCYTIREVEGTHFGSQIEMKTQNEYKEK